MNVYEKVFAIVATCFGIGLVAALLLLPDLQRLSLLLPLAGAGLIINALLLFIVFRDLFQRRFSSSGQRYRWLIVLLLFWPAVLLYLPCHGFKPRA